MAQQTTASSDVTWTWTRANKAEKAIKRAKARQDRLAAETTASPETTISAFEQNRRDAARAEYESFEFVTVNEEWVNVVNTSYDDERGHIYSVQVSEGEAVGCSCPHDTYREGKCKHRRAVESEYV